MHPLWLEILIAVLKILVVVLGFAFPVGTAMTLLGDRKQSSLIQNRVGPNRARLPGIDHALVGVPHFLADGLKMVFKEDTIPDGANRFWHSVAPALCVFPTVVMWAVIPFMDKWCSGTITVVDYVDQCDGVWHNYFSIADLDSGILYVFAMSAVSVYGAAIAGWSSNSKFPLLGGLRSTAQMISYEVTMGLSITGAILLYGTLNLNEMVRAQGELLWGWLPAWGIVTQPLAFILFFVAMIAETKRAPFNTPEGESEIVAGYFTEFGSMKFGIIQASEYVATVFVGAIVATVFLGGWQIPFLFGDGFHFGDTLIELPYWLIAFLRVHAFIIKTLVLVWLQFMLRWTLPTFRYDQVMFLGWKIMLPLSIANLVVTAFVVLVL